MHPGALLMAERTGQFCKAGGFRRRKEFRAVLECLLPSAAETTDGAWTQRTGQGFRRLSVDQRRSSSLTPRLSSCKPGAPRVRLRAGAGRSQSDGSGGEPVNAQLLAVDRKSIWQAAQRIVTDILTSLLTIAMADMPTGGENLVPSPMSWQIVEESE